MITASTARLSPGLTLIVFTDAVALGAQHVFHLHRLDHGERLAGLDLLAFGDRDRTTRPGIGQRSDLPVSGGFFAGISRAAAASRSV